MPGSGTRGWPPYKEGNGLGILADTRRPRWLNLQTPGRLGAEALMADDPSLFDQFEQWYANSRDTDALDAKTKALIGLAVVLTGNCQP